MLGSGSEGARQQDTGLINSPLLNIYAAKAGIAKVNGTFPRYDDPSELSLLYLQSFPARFHVDAARVIRDSFGSAFGKDDDLLPGARRDKYPIDRRALVQTSLHTLCARYQKQGVRSVERVNAAANYHHVEITSGPVVLIAAAVDSEKEVVRDAKYRRYLAKNPQRALHGLGVSDDDEDEPDDKGALLAVILYGPSSKYPYRREDAAPGFVSVRFPTDDFSGYAEGRVDLLARLTEHDNARQRPASPIVEPRRAADAKMS
jgi:hypothetical protein